MWIDVHVDDMGTAEWAVSQLLQLNSDMCWQHDWR